MTQYLGSKKDLLAFIMEVIKKQTEGVHSALDVFAGTGTVAMCMKEHGMSVMANDALYYSYVQNKVLTEMNEPVSKDLRDCIEFLNSNVVMANPPCEIEGAFVYQNYSPHDGCERMYFQKDNALRIDYVRQWIEKWKDELTEVEYFYLLKLLLDAVPKMANTTGTFDAFLKDWDPRTSKKLLLEESDVIVGGSPCQTFCMDAIDFARSVSADIAYLDPPYCHRQYIGNYHLLETIARYDYPEIKGLTGKRVDPEKKSVFCSKTKARKAFEELLDALDVRYILLSYNDDESSVLTTEEMSDIVRSCGKADTFRLITIPYQRYQCKRTRGKKNVNEQLYFIEK